MTQLNALMLARGQDTIIDSQSISVNTDYNLPSTVRKGQVYLINCTSTAGAVLTIKASNGDTIETIRTGYCLIVALQNSPTDSSHWKVLVVTESGIYTPVENVASRANIAATNPSILHYTRNNEVVNFAFRTTIQTTANDTASLAAFSIPIPSNFAATSDVLGTVTALNTAATITFQGIVEADTTNDIINIRFRGNTTNTNTTYVVSGTYRIR